MMQCPSCGVAHMQSHAQVHAEMEVGHLGNLGPASVTWLRQAGIHTAGELSAAGATGAFLRIRALGFKPSLNLLYALDGAITGEHWLEVKRLRKADLITALAAAQELADR